VIAAEIGDVTPFKNAAQPCLWADLTPPQVVGRINFDDAWHYARCIQMAA
jgi:hypothetical protein